MSDNMEEDLTGVEIMKNGQSVAVSTDQRAIYLFKWDYFGDCNDRIMGHPSSIDKMVKYSEDLLITACEDGLLRVVSVYPNKVISILNDDIDEEDHVQFSSLSISHDRQFLAAANHDYVVNLYNIGDLADVNLGNIQHEEAKEVPRD